jgi:riboflavin synthase
MFTGIIEATGLITKIAESGSNRTFIIESPLAKQLKIDQSIAHNGVCLTVESADTNTYQVTAIQETLAKTTLGGWKTGQFINLEQCLQWNGRLDGHIVQGHVDTTAKCITKKEANGSWEFRFEFPESFGPLVIEKGSISLDGISLTIFDVTKTEFSVAIIPYTFAHTNIKNLEEGAKVNLEFDMIGKYVHRHLELTTR